MVKNLSDTALAQPSLNPTSRTTNGSRLAFWRKGDAGTDAQALLDSLPLCRIEILGEIVSADAPARALLGLAAGDVTLAQLCALAGEQNQALQAQVTRLIDRREGFTLSFDTLTGKHVFMTGRATDSGLAVLWLDDRTAQEKERRSMAAQLAEMTIEVRQNRQTLDILSFPCWRRDVRGRLIWCNPAYAATLDTTPADVLAEQRQITTALKDRTGRALHERALHDGKAALQTKHVVIGGNRRLIEFSELPVEGGTLGFAFDMTALDDLRSDLSRHIASHAEVLETLTTAVAVFGADQKLQFHNSAFCTLWGLDDNWLETHPSLSQILEQMREMRQLPEQADFRSFKQGWIAMFTSLVEPHQDLMYRPDGSAIRLAIVPHPMGGLLFTFEDVTSRLALESSYNTLIAVQRETLDNLGEGIAVFGGDGRLDLWNPSFARMWYFEEFDLTGRPHITELSGKLAAAITDGMDPGALKTLMISNALDRLPRSGRIERGDGSVLEYHTVLLPDGGVLNSFLDVSDSVRVELALRERNAALIAADQLKLDFLANVSYQLRTPLTAMIGFSEMLIKQYFGELNDKQMEYARGALDAGERLVMLVDAILDLSTIEAGYMRLHTDKIVVDNMLKDILSLAEDWTDKQQVALRIECPAKVGTIEVDERRIKQVLLNLISNALKFTPAGGSITVTASRQTGPDGEAEVSIAVTDSGSGIPEADQARIFEPFEGGKQRKLASSAGVGLALVKSFITLHGGRVELKSTPDSGTTVTCYLPVEQPQRPEEA